MPVLLSVIVPPGSDRGPEYTEPLLAALHALGSRREVIGLEFGAHGKTIGLFCRLPATLRSYVAERLADAYPDGSVAALRDDALDPPADWNTWWQELWLSPDVLSLRTHRQFEHALSRTLTDPLAGILSALRTLGDSERRLGATLTVRPAAERRRRRAKKIAGRFAACMSRGRERLLIGILIGILIALTIGQATREDVRCQAFWVGSRV